MAIAHDAETTTAAFAATNSTTHTPVGTPRGVAVVITANVTTDNITAVDYGGVALTRIVRITDTVEAGCVEIWFVGAGLPTGAQSVTTTMGTGGTKFAEISTVTAAADTHIDVSNSVFDGSGTTANPSLPMATTASTNTAIYYGIVHGVAAPVTTTETGTTHQAGHDWGVNSAMYARKTHTGGSTTIGYTLAADDFAHAAIAISEIAAAAGSLVIRSGVARNILLRR